MSTIETGKNFFRRINSPHYSPNKFRSGSAASAAAVTAAPRSSRFKKRLDGQFVLNSPEKNPMANDLPHGEGKSVKKRKGPKSSGREKKNLEEKRKGESPGRGALPMVRVYDRESSHQNNGPINEKKEVEDNPKSSSISSKTTIIPTLAKITYLSLFHKADNRTEKNEDGQKPSTTISTMAISRGAFCSSMFKRERNRTKYGSGKKMSSLSNSNIPTLAKLVSSAILRGDFRSHEKEYSQVNEITESASTGVLKRTSSFVSSGYSSLNSADHHHESLEQYLEDENKKSEVEDGTRDPTDSFRQCPETDLFDYTNQNPNPWPSTKPKLVSDVGESDPLGTGANFTLNPQYFHPSAYGGPKSGNLWFDDISDIEGFRPGAARLVVGLTDAQFEKFEYLDHTADVQLHSWGEDIKETLEQMAVAMFNYITDVSKVDFVDAHDFEATGDDLFGLIYHFLDELLFLNVAEPFLVARRVVIKELVMPEDDEESEASEQSTDRFKIRGVAYGEPFDVRKHPVGTEIKAITYSAMNIYDRRKGDATEKGMVELFVIVDI